MSRDVWPLSRSSRGLPTVRIVRDVPWWGLVSSVTAPVLLVGGWTVAASRQPPDFNPVADTVSALAALGAADRWVMTLTFLAVGICDVVTGLALRPAGVAGRVILVAGALAGMVVAAYPVQAGGSTPHAIWASIGFAALAVWPAGAWRRGPSVPWGLRPAVCRRRRGAWPPAGLVCRRGGRRSRAGWPGRAGARHGSGGLAADGGPVLPSPRQDGPGSRPRARRDMVAGLDGPYLAEVRQGHD